MKVLIVYAHPEPKSFNGALRETAVEALHAAGHDVKVSDLYADRFDPAGGRGDFREAADPNYFKYQVEQRKAWNDGTADGFVAEIAEQQQRLVWCDLLVLQYPLWWFSVPAVLKGWIDRVLSVGFAYGGGRWFETAPLYGRRALVSLTMGATPDRWGEGKLFGRLEHILWPIHVGTLNFCGFEVLAPHIVHGPAAMDDVKRAAVLSEWRSRLSRIEGETPLPFQYANDGYRS